MGKIYKAKAFLMAAVYLPTFSKATAIAKSTILLCILLLSVLAFSNVATAESINLSNSDHSSDRETTELHYYEKMIEDRLGVDTYLLGKYHKLDRDYLLKYLSIKSYQLLLEHSSERLSTEYPAADTVSVSLVLPISVNSDNKTNDSSSADSAILMSSANIQNTDNDLELHLAFTSYDNYNRAIQSELLTRLQLTIAPMDQLFGLADEQPAVDEEDSKNKKATQQQDKSSQVAKNVDIDTADSETGESPQHINPDVDPARYPARYPDRLLSFQEHKSLHSSEALMQVSLAQLPYGNFRSNMDRNSFITAMLSSAKSSIAKDLAYVKLSRYFMHLRDVNNAIYYADKAVEARPNSFFGWYQKGIVAFDMGEFGSAELFFKRASDLDDSFINSKLMLLATVARQESRKDEATEMLDTILDSDESQNSLVYTTIGDIMLTLGNVDEAKKYYKEALKNSQLDAEALYMLSRIEKGVDAKGDYLKTAVERGHALALLHIGTKYYIYGEYAKAMEYLGRLIETQYYDESLKRVLASIAWARSYTDEACAHHQSYCLQ